MYVSIVSRKREGKHRTARGRIIIILDTSAVRIAAVSIPKKKYRNSAHPTDPEPQVQFEINLLHNVGG
jgi:hypothetical protein